MHIPTSKSHSIRGLFMALMAAGESTLTHLLRSNDTQDALHVCKTLGAHIRVQGDHVIVDGPESLCTSTDYLNTGNSGITTRFTLPLLGLRKHPTPIIVDCGDQMRTRPIRDLLHALSSLGLSIDSLKAPDCLPIRISGKLQGGQVCLDGLSSQHLSALLLTLPLAHQPSEITVNDLHGQPYIDMTLQWLSSQHIQYQRETKKNKTIYSVPGNQRYHHFHTTLT
ncbi:MAG: 3-phosphoshikimate 1-carboxyvinyltransferase, partial [Gammaproteobacteria bacterium]|nr:3-phosphoshikimate 1-carboxyvinyltransferase [Gammaproteobacteria bacterium]